MFYVILPEREQAINEFEDDDVLHNDYCDYIASVGGNDYDDYY